MKLPRKSKTAKRDSLRTFLFMSGAVALTAMLQVPAAERTWDGGGEDDLMSTPANWSGDTAPGSSDTAIVHANASKPAIVPDGDTSYATLVLGGHGSVAQTHEEGVIIQTNGTLTVSGSDGLRIGRLDNCPGTYIISNGTLKATKNSAFVGIHGSTGKLVIAGDGKVVVSSTAANTGLMLASPGPDLATTEKTYGYIEISENGILSVANLLNVGNASGGKGYYGEVKQTGGKVYIGTLQIAAQGSGHKYIQSGGMNAVNSVHIGGGASTSGTYDLDGGLLSVTNLFHVGNNGAGTLNISGTGEVESACELVIGAGSGAGTIAMDGGKIVAKNELQVGKGSAGTLNISGTGEAVANSTLVVGQGNGKGTVAIDGGKLVANGEVHAGVGNTGTLTVSDGDATFKKHLKLGCASGKTGKIVQTGGAVAMGQNSSNATFPYIGFESGSTGVYEISGGTFATVNTGLMLGNKGTGTFDISGTAVVTIAGNVNLGFETAGKGTLKLRDGGKLIANHVKKHNGTAELVEFDGGTLQARKADTILKDLANIQLKAGGLVLATENFNQKISGCTFNVSGDGKITVTGNGTVTLDNVKLQFNEKPSSGVYVFAEATDGATFSGLPTLSGDRCSNWKLKLSADKKKIYAVGPGLIIMFN